MEQAAACSSSLFARRVAAARQTVPPSFQPPATRKRFNSACKNLAHGKSATALLLGAHIHIIGGHLCAGGAFSCCEKVCDAPGFVKPRDVGSGFHRRRLGQSGSAFEQHVGRLWQEAQKVAQATRQHPTAPVQATPQRIALAPPDCVPIPCHHPRARQQIASLQSLLRPRSTSSTQPDGPRESVQTNANDLGLTRTGREIRGNDFKESGAGPERSWA